jgi:hypothetical protein
MKPVIKQAFQYDGDFMNSSGEYYAPYWVVEALFFGKIRFADNGVLFVQTSEGNMKVEVGDYIVKGIEGELYPVKASVFEKTYELLKGVGE